MTSLGWIVGNGDGTKWRTWTALGPTWTDDKEQATRYHRRWDAEAVHAEDCDAWLVEEYEPDPVAPANAASREARAAIDRAARFAKGLNTTPEEHDDIMVAVDLARAALADEAASQPREGVLDRPAILAAARAWWAANMPASHFKTATIKGDGRVDVHWFDSDESGKYTLPVDFAALHDTAPTDHAQGGGEHRTHGDSSAIDDTSHLIPFEPTDDQWPVD